MFDIEKTRSQLLGGVGFNWELASDFERARGKRALTRWASGFLGRAIECLLVGFDEPAYNLLEKAREWLLAAIAEKEAPRLFTLEEIEPLRYEDFALCNWLLSGIHDPKSLSRAIERRDAEMAANGQDKISLELKLVVYLDAGRCERAIELFETTRGLSAPKSLSQVRSQARMVYVLCKHQCEDVYTDAEIRDCLKRFLSRQVDSWLNNGHYSTVARWMKISHWDRVGSRESAREALL